MVKLLSILYPDHQQIFRGPVQALLSFGEPFQEMLTVSPQAGNLTRRLLLRAGAKALAVSCQLSSERLHVSG